MDIREFWSEQGIWVLIGGALQCHPFGPWPGASALPYGDQLIPFSVLLSLVTVVHFAYDRFPVSRIWISLVSKWAAWWFAYGLLWFLGFGLIGVVALGALFGWTDMKLYCLIIFAFIALPPATIRLCAHIADDLRVMRGSTALHVLP